MQGGDLYVANANAGNGNGGTVSVINPFTNSVTGSIQLPSSMNPGAIAAMPGGYAYIASKRGDYGVYAIVPGTNTVIGPITTGNEPTSKVAVPGGDLYMVNRGDNTVSVVGAPAVTSAPTGVSVTGVSGSGTQATVSWNAPATNGGYAVTSYVVQESTNQGTTWVNAAAITGTTATTTGLTPNTAYTLRVAAINAVGTSPWSVVAPMTTTPGGLPFGSGTTGTYALASTGLNIPNYLLSLVGGALILGVALLSSVRRTRKYHSHNTAQR